MSSTQDAAPAAWPMDIATMRDTVNRLLDPDSAPQAFPPAGDELTTLTATVRGHLEVLVPDVEAAARAQLKPGSSPKSTILQCAWDARSRMEAEPSSKTGGPVAHARRLARSLNALCDHYEQLTGSDETAEQAARRHLGVHSARCPTCLTRDDDGANVGLSCAEGERLYDEHRKTLRGARGLALPAETSG
ncbi:DUF6415 family natural product biosynthesis protein [Streptomyces sp. NPDC057623]|uniref:DUF6415 family natural product biosynthesis protein n=1 Tax=Streptomyces sp. NPDC057623 TaxID=3346187 RepID=UPI0036A8FF3E